MDINKAYPSFAKKTNQPFKMYPLMKCCSNPQIASTNDGLRHQWCSNCKREWHAPKPSL